MSYVAIKRVRYSININNTSMSYHSKYVLGRVKNPSAKIIETLAQ